MHSKAIAIVLAAAAAVLAGCATPSSPPGPGGKHLVYRDSTGLVTRQFDYPSDDFCRRVENIAGRGARCEPNSISPQLGAKATLRYNPPGVVVQAHYQNMDRCKAETTKLSSGVELITACSSQ